MSWRHKKAQRRPHPDPGVELQLQKIIGLQQRITAKEDLALDYRDEIEALHDKIRGLADVATAYGTGLARADECNNQIAGHREHIRELQQAMRDLDTDVDGIHDTITTLQEKLNPEDLAVLGETS